MKKAIVIGASSGMGLEMAKILSARGYAVGMAARRIELLESLCGELHGESFVKQVDVERPDEAMEKFEELLSEMGSVDMIIINAAVGLFNKGFDWDIEEKQLAINVTGFAAMANVAYKHLAERGGGRLAGMSSLACLRGMAFSESYAASKAFVSSYLEGLRMRAFREKADVSVTDVRPGFVDTPMTAMQKGMFWVAPADKAARQIVDAVEGGKSIVYVTKRWALLAPLIRNLPEFAYKRMMGIEKD